MSRIDDLNSVQYNKSIILLGPWIGPLNGTRLFAMRTSIFLNTSNATSNWQIPDGVGIQTCPPDVCTLPTEASSGALQMSVAN